LICHRGISTEELSILRLAVETCDGSDGPMKHATPIGARDDSPTTAPSDASSNAG